MSSANSKRSISSSPQQRMRQPLLGQSKVLPAKTNVYSPANNANINDSEVSQQTRLRSQSAEAVNTSSTPGAQQVNSVNRQSTGGSPSISAIQNIKRQYASSEGPLTSSPKPARSSRTREMVQVMLKTFKVILGLLAKSIMNFKRYKFQL